jgi:hypothetical protein
MPGLSEIEPVAAAPSKQPANTSLETATTLARRFDRTVRSIDRWVVLGVLPPALKIRGKRFWPAGVMPKFD